jgi:chromosome partitioning protein
MRTIAVIGRKGGSGKTTVAVHLAIASHLSGRATVLADTDPQRSSCRVLQGRTEPEPHCVETSGPKLFALQITSQRAGADVLVIDTPAVLEEEISYAIVAADLSLLVVRPTFLDLAACLQTVEIIRRLRKPALVVLNQAPPTREGVEPPAVKKALEALGVMRLPSVPVVLRSRANYQTALEQGRSVQEAEPPTAAGQEFAALWAYVERFAFPSPR